MKTDSIRPPALALLLALGVAATAFADIPRAIHLQGVLTDDGGLPLTGDYSLTFSIYSDTTVAAIWSQVTPVHVEDGFYEAALGVGGVSFDDPLFLGIEVGGSALGPKKPLASVPYALSVPDGSVTATKIPPGQIVRSLNSLTDTVRIVAGSQVSVLESGDSIIISASIEGAGADGDWTVEGDNQYAQTTGNVGIGVIAPGEKLDVSGAIRTDSRFVSTMAAGTPPLTVNSSTLVDNLNADLLDGSHASAFAEASHTHAVADDGDWTVASGNVYRSSGRVGIGTNSPIYTLDLDAASAGIRINTTDTGDPRLSFLVGGANKFTLGVDNSDLDKFKIGTGAVSDNTRFMIDGDGNVGIGSPFAGARLYVVTDEPYGGIGIDNQAADGDPELWFGVNGFARCVLGVDDSDGDKFKISRSTGSWLPMVTVDTLGNMGIGWENPVRRLVVSGDSAFDGIDINNSAANGDPELRFQLDYGSKFTIGVDDSDGDKLKIGTTSAGTSTRMTIDGSGNIGIGTVNPNVPLHVEGGSDVTGVGGGNILLGSATGSGIRIDDNEIQSYTSGTAEQSTLYLQKESGSRLNLGNGTLIVDSTGTVGIGGNPLLRGGLYIDHDGGGIQYALHTTGVITSPWMGLAYIGSDSAAASGTSALMVSVPNGSAADCMLINAMRNFDTEFRVDGDGDVFADGAFSGGGADFAELFRVSGGAESVEPGDVLAIDPGDPGSLRKSVKARSTLVVGVYSTRPGFVASKREWDEEGGAERVLVGGEMVAKREYKLGDVAAEFDEVPVAVVGRVPCKVTAENGPIRIGDLLVTSSTPGHAMREDDPRVGTVLGKALEALPTGTGVIEILVTLQ
ncbi:MAG: hypothetical protein ABIK65_02895 [Candidatus Eisenbacteria bacterium]